VQQPTHRFGGLYRLLNEESLRECFYGLRKAAAPGVDEVTFREYEKNLEANLKELVRRLKHKSYHARLVRRKYIPKGQGKFRPLGIPVLEDKLVQYGAAQILSAIYEADFLPCSYGYRPGRSAHDAVRALTDRLFYGRYEFVFEADIRGFFEHIRWDWLERMLALRIQDGALLGLIRKWLRAGILEEDGRVIHPEAGTPQGGIVSPVLANVYLHYVLDLWFERRVRKQCRGGCELYRYADDFVVAFGWRHEAEQFERQLKARLAQFGLEVAPDKTRIMRFGRGGGQHNERFDFLGFEFRWEKSRLGKAIVKRRTSPKKLRSAVARFTEWIRKNRHSKLKKVMATVRAKYRGYGRYYGLIGNSKSLNQYGRQTQRILLKWLNRRSQRRSFTWASFWRMLKRFQVESPKVWERSRGWLYDLSRWAEENAEELSHVQLAGRHFKPCRCASELR
jgi:group II intron reverse transcriptase/maturase